MPSTRNNVAHQDETVVKISPEDASYMYGYFDKTVVDDANQRVIVCRIPFFDREPQADTEMQVGFVHIDASQKFHQVGTTTAWNLQQGAMAEWVGPDSIIYNIRGGNDAKQFSRKSPPRLFAARIVNVKTWETNDVPRAVYAFNRVTNQIASLPFDRLHNLRRGYGYTVPLVPPERFPEHDGIWLVDLNNLASPEERLIVSFSSVRSHILSTSGRTDEYSGQNYGRVPTSDKNYWWINHAMFSADGSQLAFLVRSHTVAGTPEYSFSTLMIYDIVSSVLWRVPQVVGSHHFFGSFLLSCDNHGTFEIRFRKPIVTLPWQKGVDGHCSLSPDEKWILTDTYPDTKGFKKLFIEETHGTRKYDLGSYKALEKGPIQTRCDLHPRWDRSGHYVFFDSTHGSRRAVYKTAAFPTLPPTQTALESRHPVSNGAAPLSKLTDAEAATYGSPSWLSKCKRIYMDVGSNIGVQVRKFYEPEKYRDAPIIKLFDQQFGNAQERRRPGVETELCVLGMEPSPQLRPRLQKLEEAYQKRGWLVHIYPFAAFVEEKEMEFEMRDGVGSGTASSLNSTLNNLPKDYGKRHGKARVRAIDLAFFMKQLKQLLDASATVQFMKIDIEGSEYEVIPKLAANGMLCKSFLKKVFIESHIRPKEASTEPGLREIKAALAGAKSAHGPCEPAEMSFLDDETYANDVDDNFAA